MARYGWFFFVRFYFVIFHYLFGLVGGYPLATEGSKNRTKLSPHLGLAQLKLGLSLTIRLYFSLLNQLLREREREREREGLLR